MKYFIFSDQLSAASEMIGFAKGNNAESVLFAFSREQADLFANSGADRIINVAGTSTRPEDYAKSISGYILNDSSGCVLVSATARMRDFAAMLAGYLKWPMVNDAMAVNEANGVIATQKMLYGGAVVRSEEYSKGVVVIVPSGKFEASAEAPSPVEELKADADGRVELVKLEAVQAGESNLASAERVIGIGLGLGSADGLEEVKKLMAALDADLAGSRPAAEEKHWVSSERYVGISNLSISPKMYLALGISGQVQHIVGVRDAKIIVAVNSDENANIFKYADYGIVADMYEFIPEMIKSI